MQRESIQSAESNSSNLRFREQVEETGAKHDDTTVSFDGSMKVTPDEPGGDPYNRTGSFKRFVR